MSRIIALALAITSASASYAADIVIEEKPLSTNVQTQAVPASKPLQSQPLAADSAPSMQWQMYQKMQQMEQELREMRGQIEVLTNVIDRMKQDAKSRYLDLDQRITDLKNRPVNADGTTTIIPTQPSAMIMTPPPVASATAPAATTTTADNGAIPAAPNPEDEKKAYFAAYQVFKTGGPNKAINPMRNFIKTYPQSSFIPSAYYWLGEFYLAASPADVANAKKSFRIVAEQYADAPKAASALLKLGSFADVDGKTQDAIKYMLKIVKDFPASDEAKAAKSYLAAQNVVIPADKAKAKSDANKPSAAADKIKSPAKDDKAKSTDKTKAN